MSHSRNGAWALAFLTLAFGVLTACAQEFPNKPIRIVTSGAGGGGDFAARLIAQGLLSRMGQQVVVDNRPSGVIPGQIVSQASPDGYTLLFAGSTLWIGPLMRAAPYDPVRDFAPVTMGISTPNILVVPPSLPVKTVKEFIAMAKEKPGGLNYGSVGTGASSHLSMELFKAMAEVNIVRVAYKSGGSAHIDLVAGQVQMMMPTASAISPHVRSGRLRGLAVTSAQPSALAPGLPTIAASGLPGFEAVSPFGLFAPARTPAAIIRRLNEEAVAVLRTAEVRERLFNNGVEAVGGTPAELAAAMQSERSRLGKVIKDAGIREE